MITSSSRVICIWPPFFINLALRTLEELKASGFGPVAGM